MRQGSQRTEAVASPGKVSETERSEVERQGPPHDASRHSGKESDDERSEEERKQRPVDSALDDLEKQRDQDRHEKAPGAVRVRLKQRAPTSASFRPPGGLTPGAGVEATTRSTPPPETPAEVVGVLKAEIRAAGLPSAGLPEGVNHAWRQQGKKLLASGYSPTQIRDMIRVLVWDWVAAREMVAKWSGDPIRQMPYPDMNAVWRYRDQAAARIETGFVISASDNRDQRGRGSAYLDRYRAEERKAKRNKINPFTKKRRG